VTLRALYNFRESRFTTLSHELRVFIFGADVTPWLKGDLSVTYGNRDSFNTCVFELSNPRKIWQVTRDNLKGKWREDVGEYSEREKLNTFRWKNAAEINPSFNLKIDTLVLGQKDKRSDGTSSIPGPKTAVPPPDGTERRFRLAVNDCIFSRLDPMRIFMRNPFSSTAGEWVEIFCGFVQDHPVTTNYQTGESTLRITGYCIRQLLTKMRVQMNRLQGVPDAQPLFDDGFFADFRKPSMSTHPFGGTTLEKTIKALILGTETPKPGDVARAVGGIGEFKMGNIVCYNPSSPGNTLEQWHLMTLFGVNKVPFPTKGAEDDLWLTTLQMTNLGRSTIYLPEAFAQGPGGRFLHFLLPFEGTGAGALVASSLDNSPPKAIEWTTRWEIIRDFASKLDFQVLTSPSGDLLVEFPLYGFTPHVFTTQGGIDLGAAEYVASPEIQAAASAANEASVAKVEDDINKGVIPYGLGSLLTFEIHQIEDTLNDEAEDFPTILQVDGGMAIQPLQMNKGEEWAQNLRAFVYSPVLVSRFGVVTEQMSIPFAGQKSADYSGDKLNSPIAKRLSKLALIEYMKRMADASTWDGSVVYRPFLFPNRPVWLKRSGRMGVLTSVTNRWSIGKSAGTNFSMHMLMSERYDPETDKTTYRLPTGAANTPISYKSVWADSPNGDTNSGVRVSVGTKTSSKDSAEAAGAPGSAKPTPPTKPAAWSAKVKDHKHGDKVYGPLANIIDAAIEVAKKRGFKQIQITSTYRDPKQQQAMRLNPKDNGVARKLDPPYDFVAVGKEWGSSHQYGMAVDIKIEGGSYAEYQEFANICNQVANDLVKRTDKIKWGGTAYNNDYVHYEWNAPGGDTGTQADQYRKAMGYTTENMGTKPDYLTEVWKHFTALEGTVDITNQPKVPPTQKGQLDQRGSGSATAADTAMPCIPSKLTAQDTKMAEATKLADEIAKMMRS